MPTLIKASAAKEERIGLSTWQKVKKYRAFYVMFLPLLICLVVFSYLPMVGVLYAFTDYTPFKDPSFVGLANFKKLFSQAGFWQAFFNTLQISTLKLIFSMACSILLALMLDEIRCKWFKKLSQTILYIPHFMSWVVVSYFVYAFLNPDKGLANNIIQFFGGDKVMWYSQPSYWPFILTFMSTWKSMGYNMVVYLASITGIDATLYGAAILDGATKWQQAKFITIPSIKPMIIMMFILNIGKIFYSDFGLFWQVTQGVPNSLYNVASTFDTYIFQAIQSQVSVGQTAAAGLFQAACCCVTILVTNFIVSKLDEDSAII